MTLDLRALVAAARAASTGPCVCDYNVRGITTTHEHGCPMLGILALAAQLQAFKTWAKTQRSACQKVLTNTTNMGDIHGACVARGHRAAHEEVLAKLVELGLSVEE